MIDLPEFSEQSMYDAETHFHLLMTEDRFGKLLVHWEAMKMASTVPGDVIECGVFKGTSLARFAMIRRLLGGDLSSRLIGFDVFGDEFPSTGYEMDLAQREHWIETAGGSSISVDQLRSVFERNDVKNFELIQGDAVETIPAWAERNPGAKISLLNIDIDFFEPTTAALRYLWPRVSRGGILLLDNYSGYGTSGLSYWGDTSAVDEFFRDSGHVVHICRFPFAARPAYIVKE